MKAVRFTREEPFAVEEIDRPDPGDGEVLVDLRAASLCGSDVHYGEEASEFEPGTVPVTLGHEGAGVVREAGADVTAVDEGDHVVVHYVLGCGHCERCLRGEDNRCRNRRSVGHDVDGTFAEYVVVPESGVVRMADGVPFEWGSVAGCAVATGFHAVRRAGVEAGDAVVVFGAGGVGVHATLWAEFLGAGRVVAVDPMEERREVARAYGADATLDPDAEDVVGEVRALTDGYGADVTLECSGAPAAMDQALAAVDGENRYESGTVVSVGLQEEGLDATYWGLREGQLLVSGDHTRAELRTVLDLLADGRVDLSRSIAGRVPLADVEEGIERVASATDPGRIAVDTT